YRVSLAEIIYPAAEISEQISQAGKEASGTGNMKMMLNGAVTLGTMDGANVEIYDVVGADNIFIFGMNTPEVVQLQKNGYNPWNVYNGNQYLRDIIEFVRRGGLDGKNFDTIINYLLQNDQYMSLADFDSYRLAQQKVGETYGDKKKWNQMSLRNIAEAGIFSADRSVRDYVENIWYK
ncbi:MAG: glycogen/starch/alpha-glucan phosphorylase, partial [Flintibacter sp.]|uniref:glycogen/starch/alpha-glucan phosphorylase n=1 Tax=Flintibacter sp. TaxID=1918624 RepID=UPI002671C664